MKREPMNPVMQIAEQELNCKGNCDRCEVSHECARAWDILSGFQAPKPRHLQIWRDRMERLCESIR